LPPASTVSPPAFAVTPPANFTSVTVPIFGLRCLSCARRIERSLLRLEGVGRAKVSLHGEEVALEVESPHADLLRVVGAIRSAGYDARVTRVRVPLTALPLDSPAVSALERELSDTPGITRARLVSSTRILVVDFVPGAIDANSIRATVHRFGYSTAHPVPPGRAIKPANTERTGLLLVALFLAAATTILSAPLLTLDTPGTPDRLVEMFREAIRRLLPGVFLLQAGVIHILMIAAALLGTILCARRWMIAGARALTARIVDTNGISLVVAILLLASALATSLQDLLYPATVQVLLGAPALLWMIALISSIRLAEARSRHALSIEGWEGRSMNPGEVRKGVPWPTVALASTPLLAACWFVLGPSPSIVLALAASAGFLSAFCANPAAMISGLPLHNLLRSLRSTGTRCSDVHSLERLAKTRTLVLHDPGVLTTGKLEVSDFVLLHGVTQQELLETAGAIAAKSNAPELLAILRRASTLPGFAPGGEVTQETVSGMTGVVRGQRVIVGSREYLSARGLDTTLLEEEEENFEGQSKSFLCVARNDRILGGVAVAEPVAIEIAPLMERFAGLGIRTHLITRAHKLTANSRAEAAGIAGVTGEIGLLDEPSALSRIRRREGALTYVVGSDEAGDALTRSDLSVVLSPPDAPERRDAHINIGAGNVGELANLIEQSREAIERSRLSRRIAAVSRGILALLGAQLLFPFFGKLIRPEIVLLGVLLTTLALQLYVNRALKPTGASR